jgi:hypothetical protein
MSTNGPSRQLRLFRREHIDRHLEMEKFPCPKILIFTEKQYATAATKLTLFSLVVAQSLWPDWLLRYSLRKAGHGMVL